MKNFFNNSLFPLLVIVIIFLVYKHYDSKIDNENQLKELEKQEIKIESVIKDLEQLSEMRKDTIRIITNNNFEIEKKQEIINNEIDTTHNNDSLIALYYKFRPVGLLFE
jgi:uncharacterized membrane protein YhiD involved in acid resistance